MTTLAMGLLIQDHRSTHLFCQAWCGLVLVMFGALALKTLTAVYALDALMALTTLVVLRSSLVPALEVSILFLIAFLGQHYLISSLDTISLYVGLEIPNLCAVLLFSLHSRSTFALESALLYLLQSAFSSGLFIFGACFLFVSSGHTDWASVLLSFGELDAGMWLISLALVWKLGSAPVHAWVVLVYRGAWTHASFFISTLPKLGLFWIWQPICQGLGWLAVLSLFLATLGAFGQPTVKPLLAYSAVGLNGLWLLSLDLGSSSALWVGFCLYLLALGFTWPLLTDPFMLYSKDWHRGIALIIAATSLAGLPPLLGFISKASVLLAVGLEHALVLGLALLASMLSLLYYLYLALLSGHAEVGSLLFRTTNSRPFNLVSVDYGTSAFLLMALLIGFWKVSGISLTIMN